MCTAFYLRLKLNFCIEKVIEGSRQFAPEKRWNSLKDFFFIETTKGIFEIPYFIFLLLFKAKSKELRKRMIVCEHKGIFWEIALHQHVHMHIAETIKTKVRRKSVVLVTLLTNSFCRIFWSMIYVAHRESLSFLNKFCIKFFFARNFKVFARFCSLKFAHIELNHLIFSMLSIREAYVNKHHLI